MTVDWGAVIFAAIVFGFLFLVVKALRRMRHKGRLEPTEREPRRDPGKSRKSAKSARKQPPRPRRPKKPLPSEAGTDAAAEPRKAGRAAAVQPVSDHADARSIGEGPSIDAEEQQRLADGLAKTRGGFVTRLGKLFRGKQLDETLLGEIEEVLFTADIGVGTAQLLLDGLRKRLGKKELQDPPAVWAFLKQRASEILDREVRPLTFASTTHPFVLLVIGVNGSGKTTTIGKLAAKLKADGKRVLLAAGDTFRAAAVQQLEVWGERAAVPVVKGNPGADPASVIVEALQQAKRDAVDIVIADTAGRLQTKVSLMEELQKVRRAIAKHVTGAPHETLLVLDATTGQNALSQANLFNQAMEISGVVLTKLDGTAKGGVILGISHELRVPVRFIGIGERVADLRPFEPKAFVSALFGDTGIDPPSTEC